MSENTIESPASDEASKAFMAETVLICEKLLGWKRHCDEPACDLWRADGQRLWFTPSFLTWEHAGLILDAVAERKTKVEADAKDCWYVEISGHGRYAATAPAAIRAAALAYIRNLP